MEYPKRKHGNADEVWKVLICATQVARADDLINGLAFILGETGINTEQSIKVIQRYSGEEIAEALLQYKEQAVMSVEAALKHKDNTNGAQS